ncbi:Serine/threonine-protein kinase PrkC [Rubripirellula amarantea]|uniref:Serine/threonine-protein kinase PrkC n=1 Tax=Rubripirellula amarantea TaxID=2527999 RepID=A0A5C5WXB8_9BACT|nr:bifunctional serine/threonine-protein kinase/formylglycine-generating enzyme family protein [Rubripirellula amarantea]TWT54909.1 Serine/threonine-protein kinase PrkC [Rubripirellula amarantea]
MPNRDPSDSFSVDGTKLDMDGTMESNKQGSEHPGDGGTRDESYAGMRAEAMPTQVTNSVGDVPVVPTSNLKQVGRYRIISLLGAGGFANVYLAEDETLRRRVSVKVPHSHRILGPSHLKRYMDEAMMVAALEHPKIVPVYDVGHLPNGLCYVVSKYIEGQTLADAIMVRQLGIVESIKTVIDIAETLQHVHECGIVHRDIKPSNILQDVNGTLYVNDFGLALTELDESDRGRVIGTPGYMSPEQASGEGHLVDGRSDIFSLGVMLYELLAGRRPFRGDSSEQVLYKLRHAEPKPIRQYNASIPRELDQVCQKAMAKLASQRYAATVDLASDLKQCLRLCDESADEPSIAAALKGPSSVKTSDGSRVVVIPKGLRSYDAHDATFFRHMLPGPYDLHGLPESIRFWKNRIDPSVSDTDKRSSIFRLSDESGESVSARDGQQLTTEPFRVGVIYGTSGCGKSSFVRAGLIPSLDPRVQVCMLDATAGSTIADLATLLDKKSGSSNALSDLRSDDPSSGAKSTPELSLDERMAWIRRRGERTHDGRKVLIVIDQFEQWLSAADPEERQTMVRALRQCDGESLQAILLVRDDFWLAISRLMREMDIPLTPSHNLAMIDLLDKHHAAKLLRMFGRAYGRIGQEGAELRREQSAFIDEAVELLAIDEHVVAVRLTLFAEIMKSRDWTRSSLRKLGGMDRIVERFLIESFDLPSSRKDHRVHAQSARQLLDAMLPKTGLIRSAPVPQDELLQLLGGQRDPANGNELLRILDEELKLITLVESSSADTSETRLYQLTHDSLVPAIRQWISHHESATMASRARRDLRTRAAAWQREPSRRELPSLYDLVRFLVLAKSWYRDNSERAILRAASVFYGWRLALLAVAGVLIAFATVQIRGQSKSDVLVNQLRISTTAQLPNTINAIRDHSRYTFPDLRAIASDSSRDGRERFLAALVLPDDEQASRGTSKSDGIDFDRLIHDRLSDAPFDLLALALKQKPHWPHRISELLIVDLSKQSVAPARRLRAGLMLASCDDTYKDVLLGHRELLTDLILIEATSNRLQYATLVKLTSPLAMILRDEFVAQANSDIPDARRDAAIGLMQDMCSGDCTRSLSFAADLSSQDFLKVVLPHTTDLETLHQFAVKQIEDELESSHKPKCSGSAGKRWGHLASLALVSAQNRDQVTSAWGNISKLMEVCSDSMFAGVLIHTTPQLAAGSLSSNTMLNPSDWVRIASLSKQSAKKREFDWERSVRHTVLFTAGQMGLTLQDDQQIRSLRLEMRDIFANDTDPGTHAAAWWSLCQMEDEEWVEEKLSNLMTSALDASRKIGWRVNKEGITLVTVDASDVPDVNVVMEVACGETTVEQFMRFDTSYEHQKELKSDDVRAPVGVITWPEAVAYCQWLTLRDGMSDTDLAYEIDEHGEFELAQDYRDRKGYRLPVAAEWRHLWSVDKARVACFNDDTLIYEYLNIMPKSNDRPERIGGSKPDRIGIFNLGGNCYEWTSNRFEDLALSLGMSYGHKKTNRFEVDSDRYLPREINWRAVGFRVVRTIPSETTKASKSSEVSVPSPSKVPTALPES